jgi:exodeoxyribonuclease III
MSALALLIGEAGVVRLATWNVNSIRAHEARVLRWVEAHQPDVLALQEIMCDDGSFPRCGFTDLGYRAVVHGRPGRGGVALLSRLPMGDVMFGMPGAVAPFDEPRLIAATIAGVRVFSIYAPNGRKVGTDAHRFKLAWFALLGHVLDGELEDCSELMVLADLNIAPTDRDVWDASRYRNRNLTSGPERAAYERLIDLGLVDVVRLRVGEKSVFTWWNRRGDFYETDRGWRLDHVLASAMLAQRVLAASVDRPARAEPGPDHAPIVIELGE